MILGIYLPYLWAAAILIVLAGFFTGGNIPFFAILALKTYSDKSSFASSLVILALTLAMFVFPGFVGEMAKLVNMTFALTIACFCPLICAPLILSVKT